MKKLINGLIFFCLCTSLSAQAKSAKSSLQNQSDSFAVTDVEINSSLKKAASFLNKIQINGGYVETYSPNLQSRWGELLTIGDTAYQNFIKIEYVTPKIGSAFLNAYRVTKDPEYLKIAEGVASALKLSQLDCGGWSYWGYTGNNKSELKNFVNKPGYKLVQYATWDDNISQSAIDFLLDYNQFISKDYNATLQKALQFLLTSQYPNGAWPDWYPLMNNYLSDYTFNDQAINNCVNILIKAYTYTNNVNYLNRIKLAGDFIISSQLKAPQAGWAQQYNKNMQPSGARTFELPGLESQVTIANIYTLLQIYNITNDNKYLKPIDPAFAWLQLSKLTNGKWSRFYEVGTNKPFVSSRKSVKSYDLNNIDPSVSTYVWQGDYNYAYALDMYNLLKTNPAKFKQIVNGTEDRIPIDLRKADLQKKCYYSVKNQQADGSWRNSKQIVRVVTIVKNVNTMTRYLALEKNITINFD